MPLKKSLLRGNASPPGAVVIMGFLRFPGYQVIYLLSAQQTLKSEFRIPSEIPEFLL